MEASSCSSAAVCRRHAVIVAVLSLAAAGWQAFYLQPPLDSVYADMRGYIERALDLLVAPSVVPYERFYPPGTHYFYALVFAVFGFASGLSAIAVLQVVLLAAANVMVYLLAAALFSNRRAALFIACALALYLPRVSLVSYYVSEPLFMFLIASGQLMLIHGLMRTKNSSWFYLAGLLFGLAIITKGQGLAFLAGALAMWLMPRFKYLRSSLPAFIAGSVLPVLCVFAVNSAIAGRPMLSVAANDMFNSYLGQTQRRGIGCYHEETNTFYFFHNNNSYFNDLLSAPITIRATVLDREFFRHATLQLWAQQPLVQFVRSLNNVRELFLPYLYWPARGSEVLRELNSWLVLAWNWVFLPLAALGIVTAARRRSWGWQMVFVGVPVAGIGAMAFISMGQPRYLLPFQHHLMMLALPALCLIELYFRIGLWRMGDE